MRVDSYWLTQISCNMQTYNQRPLKGETLYSCFSSEYGCDSPVAFLDSGGLQIFWREAPSWETKNESSECASQIEDANWEWLSKSVVLLGWTENVPMQTGTVICLMEIKKWNWQWKWINLGPQELHRSLNEDQ